MRWGIPYVIVTGLVLAGIVHISIVLLMPNYGTRDAWAFLSGRTDLFSFTLLNSNQKSETISEMDPFFSHGVCRFDLEEGALKLEGPDTPLFWSISVFDETGTVIYGLNNRTAIDGHLNLVIVNPIQTLELRESLPEEFQTAVVIEANVRFGFVVVRVLQPDKSWEEQTGEFLKEITCSRFETAVSLGEGKRKYAG